MFRFALGVTAPVAGRLMRQPLGRNFGAREENRAVEDRIQQIESFARQSMSTVTAPDLRIAHDFKHVDRVRGWALHIASAEAIQDLGLVEAAALLHDIGLTRVETDAEARETRFVGSPTIRLDGEDLFSSDSGDYALGCRVYSTPEGLRGWPTREMLYDALRERLV